MTKRESIIVTVTAILVVAVAIYFIIDRGLEAPPGAARPDSKVVQEFVSVTEEGLKKAALPERLAYISERASVEWENDPFLGRALIAKKPESAKAAQIPASLAYTGFIIAGRARLAVINGMEYEVGEVVLGSELVVQSIDPQNVVVKQLEGKESFNIPFTGEVLR